MDTYENCDFSKRNNSENRNSATDPETEDDYENTQQWRPKPKQCTASSDRFDYKISILVLGLLLMLGALTSLCAIGILYHRKVVSIEKLSEKYKNATATLMVLEDKANEKERMYEMQKVKHQELVSTCNETERPYKELKVKHHELVSACNETEQLYEMLKMKYQQVHERLSACNANQNCKPCEEGWKSLGLKCYYFSTEKLNWIRSRDYCVGKGGHLVIITSQTEQDFVSSQIGETHWIGLNDLETEGKWMWVNNQPLKETGVMFWYSAPEGPNEPDNWKMEDPSGENCAALGDARGNIHKWFDASCKKIKKCICEK
ncbi:C-type lectin domain family 4 member E-like [Ictalurus furcatus]|uniref:C-type lectin domain family 4 member E-like n=1 Tax=Ictalurus furcatus TaxID=66913 RepID=UPI002350D703|nr:C-type lectin domain family 4 member E-like [Ictalurus furcatus]